MVIHACYNKIEPRINIFFSNYIYDSSLGKGTEKVLESKSTDLGLRQDPKPQMLPYTGPTDVEHLEGFIDTTFSVVSCVASSLGTVTLQCHSSAEDRDSRGLGQLPVRITISWVSAVLPSTGLRWSLFDIPLCVSHILYQAMGRLRSRCTADNLDAAVC